MAATRADDRAHGVGRSPAPLFVPRCKAETYDAPRSQMTANSREDSVFFDLYDEDTEGARPDRLFEVRPQERDQRRTVEQIVDIALIVPSLDVPVPRRTNWWRCAGSSMFAFPSRSSKCPRSHLHPVIAGAMCASLSRRQNCWWKCRRLPPIDLRPKNVSSERHTSVTQAL